MISFLPFVEMTLGLQHGLICCKGSPTHPSILLHWSSNFFLTSGASYHQKVVQYLSFCQNIYCTMKTNRCWNYKYLNKWHLPLVVGSKILTHFPRKPEGKRIFRVAFQEHGKRGSGRVWRGTLLKIKLHKCPSSSDPLQMQEWMKAAVLSHVLPRDVGL